MPLVVISYAPKVHRASGPGPSAAFSLVSTALTLGAHAQRGLLQLGLCVCVSVTLHLTSRTFVRPRNDTIYPTGNEGQNICGVFSENAPLQS